MTRPSPEADFGVPSVGPATPIENNSRNNDSLDALVSQHFDAAAGARPSYILKGGTWAFDNGASPQEIEIYFFDGTEDILLYTIDVSANTVSYPAIANTAFLNVAQTFTKTQTWSKGIDVASATALTFGVDGNYFDITGTTDIETINTIGIGTVIKLHHDGILDLIHDASDLILPGGANITTAAGDESEWIEYATGDWRMLKYQIAADAPGSATGGLVLLSAESGAQASYDFATGIDSTYDTYEINFNKLVLSNDGVNLFLRYSIDGGSSFISANYAYTEQGLRADAAAANAVSTSAAGIILNSATIGNANQESISGRIIVHAPAVGNHVHSDIKSGYLDSGNNLHTLSGIGEYTGATTAINALSIVPSAGTIASGSATIHGITKS